ncbi:MAG TPA: CheR family methyltransferase [Xanthobacteraceae bacterium]|nr:CheR family methyltransferase [Xanthobacteraceae bacterium]
MRSEIHRSDLDGFRAAIVQRMGLQFDDAKLGLLGEVLQRRLDRLGHSSEAYLQSLEQDSSSADEIALLAQSLTVGETYFFRNIEQFRALAEVVLPARIRRRPGTGMLRVLSAGCASGEEAYSIAIAARVALADPRWQLEIVAVDINPAGLEKAARARYSSWALRDTPPEIQSRWFRASGREWILDDAVRCAVKFEQRNLAADDPGLWQPAAYDVIFCRNVLMYFAPEQMRAVVHRIARSLAPGGFLFLGHAETLRGVSDAFHLRHSHGTFYYEQKEDMAPAGHSSGDSAAAEAPAAALSFSPRASVATSATWFDTIRQASERVAALVPAATNVPSLGSPTSAAPSRATLDASGRGGLERVRQAQEAQRPWDVTPALDFLRHERFAEALAHIRIAPPARERDPDVLLLEATLLAHSGQLAAAEDACLRLLLIDELNAGAHYLLALCREHSGHRQRAREHDRIAAYLDPSFAMPRLHLGLLARRDGDRAAARSELAQALNLLRREDASRLLLFAGGFSREALMALCESSLKESGVPA